MPCSLRSTMLTLSVVAMLAGCGPSQTASNAPSEPSLAAKRAMLNELAWICSGKSADDFSAGLRIQADLMEMIFHGQPKLQWHGWFFTSADEVGEGVWRMSYQWTATRDPGSIRQEYAFFYDPATQEASSAGDTPDSFCSL